VFYFETGRPLLPSPSLPHLDRRAEEFVDTPVAVAHSKAAGSSDVSSCNYAARKKGLRNGLSPPPDPLLLFALTACEGMFMSKAKELCPELVVLQYDFEQYEEVSEQVLCSLSQTLSSHSAQIYRIFFTASDLLHLSADRVTVQPVSVDEAYLEIMSAGDRQIDGMAVAALIRQRIYDITRCQSSAGVGENMLLARLATRLVCVTATNLSQCLIGEAKWSISSMSI
jgi:DNA repair protein REV1